MTGYKSQKINFMIFFSINIIYVQTSNPACLELEVKMMDWLAKLLGLPEHFLNSPNGTGAGVIQVSIL